MFVLYFFRVVSYVSWAALVKQNHGLPSFAQGYGGQARISRVAHRGWRNLRICPFPRLYAAVSICVRTIPQLRVGKFVAIIVAPRWLPPAPLAGFLRAPGLQSAVPKQTDWKSVVFEKLFRELRSNFPGVLCDSDFRFKEPRIVPAFARLRCGWRITRMSVGMTNAPRMPKPRKHECALSLYAAKE